MSPEERLATGIAEGVDRAVLGHGDLSAVTARGQQLRRRRGTLVLAAASTALAAIAITTTLVAAGPQEATTAAGPRDAATTSETTGTAAGSVPEQCLAAADAQRGNLQGAPVWARFCPGGNGQTRPAEVPSDALVTHLDSLEALSVDDSPDAGRCAGGSRTYRLQVGFGDGTTAEVVGRTDPTCIGQILNGSPLSGPPDLGVYGAVMKAFGQQYADEFDPAAPTEPLRCPKNARNPDDINLDGASSRLDTGYLYGDREPMTMPLTAVGGIVCTWETEDSDPVISDLTPQAAERVRIGLHAILSAMVDCAGSDDPTYTAIVEDKTGTRRAVTIIESECSTVIRSDSGFGLGFTWLDR